MLWKKVDCTSNNGALASHCFVCCCCCCCCYDYISIPLVCRRFVVIHRGWLRSGSSDPFASDDRPSYTRQSDHFRVCVCWCMRIQPPLPAVSDERLVAAFLIGCCCYYWFVSFVFCIIIIYHALLCLCVAANVYMLSQTDFTACTVVVVGGGWWWSWWCLERCCFRLPYLFISLNSVVSFSCRLAHN